MAIPSQNLLCVFFTHGLLPCNFLFFSHLSKNISVVKDIKASVCKNAEQIKINRKVENVKPSVMTPQTKSEPSRIDFSTQVMGTLPLQGKKSTCLNFTVSNFPNEDTLRLINIADKTVRCSCSFRKICPAI